MTRRAYNEVLVTPSINPGAKVNGTVNGTGVDLWYNALGAVDHQKFRSAVVVFQTGTVTDGSHVAHLQDSDDNSTYADADAADIQGSLPTFTTNAAHDNAIAEIGYHGVKRYVRAQLVTTGATTGGVIGAVVVLSEPRRRPVSHPAALP